MAKLQHKIAFLLAPLFLGACERLDTIPYDPALAAADWCKLQPCLSIGNMTISQPFSSFLVFLLAFFTLWVGYYYIQNHQNQSSRAWWGVSLLLGGIGAVVAGITYQSFGYELKCAGREYCVYTNWLEVVYNWLTAAGAYTLIIAVAHSTTTYFWQCAARLYALVMLVIYAGLLGYGAYLPDKFLLSFEVLILFSIPNYLFLFIWIAIRYLKNRDELMFRFLITWMLLFITLGSYFYYMVQGFTQQLWQAGYWFSDNDLPHVGMLLWAAYVYWGLKDVVRDRPEDTKAK